MRSLFIRAVFVGIGATCAGHAVADPAGAGHAEAAGRGKVVVVCDAAGSATDDARMRAGVYDVARKRGFTSDPRADVIGAARAASALEGGSVSALPAPLQSMRQKLGATVVIRVSLEWERADQRGIRVTVVGEGGDTSKVVAAPSADPRPLVAETAGELLDQVAGTAAPAAPAPAPGAEQRAQWLVQPGVRPPADNTGDAEHPLDPKEIRRRWDARGGVRASYEARGMVTALLIPDVPYASANPVDKTRTDRGTTNTLGVGGGLGARLAMMVLPVPDPAVSSGSFAGFRLGVGADVNVLYVREPVGFSYQVVNGTIQSHDTKYGNRAWMYASFPAQLGIELGIGRFRTQTIWRGVLLGLSYSPTWFYRLDIASLNGDGAFNYAGFEANLDITSLEATSAGRSESQIRLFSYVLPRVKPDLPWLVSLGIGAVWY